jgi:peroxiredoxin
MAKNKPKRTLQHIGVTQRMTEENTRDKFAETKETAQDKEKIITPSAGRFSPQISCTVLPEDKQLLNDITMYSINKAGKPLNTSSIIRALIRLGHKRKDELEF